MSGVIKSVGKAFKSILKVAKVVLPIALGVAAIVFTAGAALAPASSFFAGGMGGAMSSIFGSSTLGNIVAGAATQAGFGALTGAATAAISGKDVMKGAQAGAAVGAVTGAATGLLKPQYIDPFNVKAADAPGVSNGLLNSPPTTAPAPTAQSGGGTGPSTQGPPPMSDIKTTQTNGGGGGGTPPATPTWLERNGSLAGNGLLAVGNAIGGGEDAQARKDIAADERAGYAKNYAGSTNGLLKTGAVKPDTGLAQTATPQPFSFVYEWNPDTKRVEKRALDGAATAAA